MTTRRRLRRRAMLMDRLYRIGLWAMLIISVGVGIYAVIMNAFFNAEDKWFWIVIGLCLALDYVVVKLFQLKDGDQR